MGEENNSKSSPYATYGEVPWYRKNWFALVCGLFFGPGLLPTLATGNFYYERKGEVRAYGKVAKFILLAWSVGSVFFLINAVYTSFPSDSRAVKLVKSGSLQMCDSVNVQQMVTSFMGKPSWDSGTSENGTVFVNVGGDITLHDKPVRGVLQFSVDEKAGSFEFRAFETNGVPQPNILAMGLMRKMCDSAIAQNAMSGKSSKPLIENEPKNAEPAQTIAEPNDVKQSRFGVLSIVNNVLVFKGQPVTPAIEGNAGLSINGIYQIGDRDVALVMDIGGSACPAQFYFVSLTQSGAQATKSFGTCSDLAKVYTMSTGLAVTMPVLSKKSPTDADEQVYVYKDGVLLEEGQPTK